MAAGLYRSSPIPPHDNLRTAACAMPGICDMIEAMSVPGFLTREISNRPGGSEAGSSTIPYSDVMKLGGMADAGQALSLQRAFIHLELGAAGGGSTMGRYALTDRQRQFHETRDRWRLRVTHFGAEVRE